MARRGKLCSRHGSGFAATPALSSPPACVLANLHPCIQHSTVGVAEQQLPWLQQVCGFRNRLKLQWLESNRGVEVGVCAAIISPDAFMTPSPPSAPCWWPRTFFWSYFEADQDAPGVAVGVPTWVGEVLPADGHVTVVGVCRQQHQARADGADPGAAQLIHCWHA